MKKKKNQENNYISLQEATKYCNYSQEYLSLRARQGKLKAVKMGRNWVTTKEWLAEYLEKVKEYKKSVIERKKKNFEKSRTFPENLPIGEFSELIPEKLVSVQEKFFSLRFTFVLFVIFVFLGLGVYFFFHSDTKENLLEAGSAKIFSLFGYREKIKENIKIQSKEFMRAGFIFRDKEKNKSLMKKFTDIFKEDVEWFWKKVTFLTIKAKNLPRKIAQAIKEVFIGEKKTKFVKEKTDLQPGEKAGMVVVPSTDKDEEVKEKIKSAFSDEVKVTPKDKTSGIIVPIFKERVGPEYMYVLVPVNN